jgi:hypothetical protein
MCPKQQSGKPVNKSRLLLFKMIAVSLPFVVLLLVELFLRAIGYGNDLRVFLTDQTGEYYYMNPEIGKRYFKQEINATDGNIDFFRKDKTPETIRIFVLGSSVALGFPYMYNGAFPRMLNYRLQRQYPDKNIEVINLSLSGINSYAVLDMAKKVVDYQPDAVMIYCGQNEYHGALGVASSGSFGNSSFFIKAFILSKQSRLMQWVYNLVYSKPKDDISTDLYRTLMERLASGQTVEYGSEKFQRGLQQFEDNITGILEIFNKHHIPVFIGNLVTNMKDLHPFISGTGENKANPAFENEFERAKDFLARNDTVHALDAFTKAYALDSLHAGCCFHIGTLEYARGNYDKAKAFFTKAKQYDQLRFRAPEEFNVFLEKVSHEFDHVHFVDVCKAFETESPHGIVGDETLLEHVHPNLHGYSLMADAFLKSYIGTGMMRDLRRSDIPEDTIIRQYPVSKFDTVYGYISNILLRENWPFNEPLPTPTAGEKTYEGKVAGGFAVRQYSWKEAMEKLYSHYMANKQYGEALIIAEGLCLEYSHVVSYHEMAAKLALQIQDDDRYFFYLSKIWRAFTQNYPIAEQLFITALKNDKPELAIPYIEYGIQHSGRGSVLTPLKLSAEEIVALKSRLPANPQETDINSNIHILNQIAGLYVKFSNFEAGQKYARQVLAIDAGNQTAKAYLEIIEKESKNQ